VKPDSFHAGTNLFGRRDRIDRPSVGFPRLVSASLRPDRLSDPSRRNKRRAVNLPDQIPSTRLNFAPDTRFKLGISQAPIGWEKGMGQRWNQDELILCLSAFFPDKGQIADASSP
jgi:hypothetical protein